MRILKAIITNIIAFFAPGFYVRWTGETGRGRKEESIESVAQYMTDCFFEYFEKLQISRDEIESYLKSKKLLEYGPGDVPGVALLMYAYGAEKVVCIDRFPLINLSDKNIKIIEEIIKHLPEKNKARANEMFKITNDVRSGFKKECLEYIVEKRDGIVETNDQFDLIYSRAVLEHVNNLDKTFKNMSQLLSEKGSIIHQVDLKSHGLHINNPLDFLTWSSILWWLMYSNKGVPNRWRVNHYRELLSKYDFIVKLIESTGTYNNRDVFEIKDQLASQFQAVSEEDLGWQGVWLVAIKEK